MQKFIYLRTAYNSIHKLKSRIYCCGLVLECIGIIKAEIRCVASEKMY